MIAITMATVLWGDSAAAEITEKERKEEKKRERTRGTIRKWLLKTNGEHWDGQSSKEQSVTQRPP